MKSTSQNFKKKTRNFQCQMINSTKNLGAGKIAVKNKVLIIDKKISRVKSHKI